MLYKQRPVEYGGTDPNPLGQSLDHLGFLQLAKNWETSALDQAGDLESGGRADGKISFSSARPAPPAINSSAPTSKPSAAVAVNSPIEKSMSSDSPLSSPATSGGGWFSRFGKSKAAQKEAYLGKSNWYVTF